MSNESRQHFHILREIDSGGFGSVYLAKVVQQDGFSRLAALKLLHAKWSDSEEIAGRMRDEARMLGLLRHPNIVDVFGLTQIDGRVAIVMEYLDAIDCHRLVAQRGREHELPVRCALEIIAAAASALDAAFNRPPVASDKPLRVIHRDIKPSNIMIDADGVAKVLDFGGARGDFDEREAKTEAMTFGSIDYMAPERLFMEPEAPASDIYSLGATLFEMLCGEPFGKSKLSAEAHEKNILVRFETLLERNPLGNERIAEEVLLLLRDMLAYAQEDRPSAAKVVQILRPLARAFPEQPTLAEWAEIHIPPLLVKQRARQAEKATSTLVGTIVYEDVSDAIPRRPSQVTDSAPLPPPPAPPPSPTSPPRAPDYTDEVAAPSSSRNTLLAAGVVVAVLLMGLAGVIALGGVIGYTQMATGAPPPVTPEAPAEPPPAPAVPAAPEAPAAPQEPGATFKSALPNTRTLNVRCDEGQGRGEDVAHVVGTKLGRCTVTAITEERSRMTVVVERVKVREYTCFADGKKECK